MSDDHSGFAPPPFKPDTALEQIKRSLRDLKLAERGHGFDLRGKRVVELGIEGDAIHLRLARTLALTPPWDAMKIKTAAEQRKFIDEMRKRLARWTQDE